MAKRPEQNDRYRLSGTYERLQRTLLDLPEDGRLDKTLAYWVLPTDRRLPIAFLDRSLRELLSQPLEDLMATPGVGQKKILGFFDLLRRAAKGRPNETPFGLPDSKPDEEPAAEANPFDPATVSEAIWSTWCDSVRRFGFEREKLGRLAPTLQSLPTVIWRSTLGDYSDLTLAEIRKLRTHGQKRVEAILEVFCTVHEAASTAILPENIDLRLGPAFAVPLTHWIVDAAGRQAQLSLEEIQQQLVSPLIEQVRIDLGTTVAGIAGDRLHSRGEAPTVKHQADVLGVTRARVYQLMEDCGKVMDVRWPEGRWLLMSAGPRLGGTDQQAVALIQDVRELFFPDDRQALTPQSNSVSREQPH